jgi:4a-hydroxytetrahydrobiopterin dehydratase
MSTTKKQATARRGDALRRKRCVPCEGDASPLTRPAAERMLPDIPGWSLSHDAKSLSQTWTFKDFMAAIAFINAVAKLAEAEGHHPDIRLFGYRRVTLELSTHAIKGLSENDFILAAKINALPAAS